MQISVKTQLMLTPICANGKIPTKINTKIISKTLEPIIILDHVLIYPNPNRNNVAYTVASPIINGKNANILKTIIDCWY